MTQEMADRALSEVSTYDIFGTPVIIQVVYSSSKDPSVLFLPVVEDPRTNSEPKPPWRIEVAWSAVPNAAPKTTTTGTLGMLKPGTQNALLSKAAITATRYLSETGQLSIPTILYAYKTPDGRYHVWYEPLPVVMGGQLVVIIGNHFAVNLSEDFTACWVSQGR